MKTHPSRKKQLPQLLERSKRVFEPQRPILFFPAKQSLPKGNCSFEVRCSPPKRRDSIKKNLFSHGFCDQNKPNNSNLLHHRDQEESQKQLPSFSPRYQSPQVNRPINLAYVTTIKARGSPQYSRPLNLPSQIQKNMNISPRSRSRLFASKKQEVVPKLSFNSLKQNDLELPPKEEKIVLNPSTFSTEISQPAQEEHPSSVRNLKWRARKAAQEAQQLLTQPSSLIQTSLCIDRITEGGSFEACSTSQAPNSFREALDFQQIGSRRLSTRVLASPSRVSARG